MSGTELKVTEKLSKHGRGHKEIITTDDNLPVDRQLKTILLSIQEKYNLFIYLMNSDVITVLNAKPVNINGKWYLELKGDYTKKEY